MSPRGIGKSSRSIGLGDALVDRDGDADVVEDPQRVLRAVVDRDVAVDGRRGDQLQVRVEGREHERDGVVGPGIDVEDQLLRHRPSVRG